MYVSDLNIMQLHVRGQGNHVIECEGTENVGQIKVSYLFYFYLPAPFIAVGCVVLDIQLEYTNFNLISHSWETLKYSKHVHCDEAFMGCQFLLS